MATYGGDLSWQRFVLYEGRAVPFEIAHVAGNVAFALVAGPAMLRMLARFRERFEWRRGGEDPGAGGDGRPPARRAPSLGGGIAALLLVVLAAALAPAPARAAPAGGEIGRRRGLARRPRTTTAASAPRPARAPGAETTCWAMLGLEAAGVNPLDVRKGGKTPVDFLRGGVAKLKRPGDLARTILALEGAGVDPRDFGGHNLVSRLLAKRRDDGSYEGWPGSTAFAVMALRGAGRHRRPEEDARSGCARSRTRTAAGATCPARRAPPTAPAPSCRRSSPGSKGSKRGLDYLRTVQRKGGGFPLGGNGEVNAQSTAWAIQGIIPAGADPEEFRRGGASAPDYLAARQAKDGHYRYSKSSDQTPTWVTGKALAAAAGKYYPVPTVPRLKTSAPSASQPSPTTAPQPDSSPTTPVTPSTTPAPAPLPGFESSSFSERERCAAALFGFGWRRLGRAAPRAAAVGPPPDTQPPAAKSRWAKARANPPEGRPEEPPPPPPRRKPPPRNGRTARARTRAAAPARSARSSPACSPAACCSAPASARARAGCAGATASEPAWQSFPALWT